MLIIARVVTSLKLDFCRRGTVALQSYIFTLNAMRLYSYIAIDLLRGFMGFAKYPASK